MLQRAAKIAMVIIALFSVLLLGWAAFLFYLASVSTIAGSDATVGGLAVGSAGMLCFCAVSTTFLAIVIAIIAVLFKKMID